MRRSGMHRKIIMAAFTTFVIVVAPRHAPPHYRPPSCNSAVSRNLSLTTAVVRITIIAEDFLRRARLDSRSQREPSVDAARSP